MKLGREVVTACPTDFEAFALGTIAVPVWWDLGRVEDGGKAGERIAFEG